MSTVTKSILYITAILPKAEQEALTHYQWDHAYSIQAFMMGNIFASLILHYFAIFSLKMTQN